jgi:hypothetical protein
MRTLMNVGYGFNIHELHEQNHPWTEWPWTDDGRLTWDRFDRATWENLYYEAACLAQIDGLTPVLRGVQDAGFPCVSMMRDVAETFLFPDGWTAPFPTWAPFMDTAALGDVLSTPDYPVGIDFDNVDHCERIWTHMLRPFFQVFDDSADRLRLERTPNGRPLVWWWGIGQGVVPQGMEHWASAQRLLDHISFRMEQEGFGRPDHIVDTSWPAAITAYGIHAWFTPPTASWSTHRNPRNGIVTGMAVPGFRNYSDGQRQIDRRDGETLRDAFRGWRKAKVTYGFLESLTNIEESAGFYRRDAWGTRYLDLVRARNG